MRANELIRGSAKLIHFLREDDNLIVYVMFVVVYNFNRKTLLPVIPRESGGLIFIFKL